MDLIFGYLAGLLTLINPCVLPVLPLVLGASLQAGRHGPLALAAGLGTSFVAFGMFVATIGHAIGLTEEVLANTGGVLMILFAAVLMVPRLARGFETATAGLAAQADHRIGRLDPAGTGGQVLGGVLLGAVWSPCVGPTLGGAIALATAGESLLRATLIMTSFALGVATLVVLLGYGARGVILRRRDAMRRMATAARPVTGIMFLLVGLLIVTKSYRPIEAWLLDVLPLWLQDLSVAL